MTASKPLGPGPRKGVRRAKSAGGQVRTSTTADRRDQTVLLGQRLRARREERALTLRQFARDLNVSPSFISALENGKTRPSVATLYLISTTLNVSIDELFAPEDDVRQVNGLEPMHVPEGGAPGPVVRPHERRKLELDSGVVWERLAGVRGSDVEFMAVRYDSGGSSTPDDRLTRHAGVEFGYILSGTLEIILGFGTHILKPGDSIAFDSSTPHRFVNRGSVPVEAVWLVEGRNEGTHNHWVNDPAAPGPGPGTEAGSRFYQDSSGGRG